MKAIVLQQQQFGEPQAYEFPIDAFVSISEEDCIRLETIFRECNHVDGREWIADKPYRSLSVGDMVVLDDTTYVCQMIGWKKLTELV